MKGRGVTIKRRRRVGPKNKGPAKMKSDPVDCKKAVESATVGIGERELQLARALSDTERRTRDASLELLEQWLASNGSSLAAADWDRLWKALFYCLWMADKPPVISLVVDRLVDLGNVAGREYVAAMYRCLMREWHGIDRHRVDKYYELITVSLKKSVADIVQASAVTEESILNEVNSLCRILDENLFERVAFGASGVALHVMDYWVESVLLPVLTCKSSGGLRDSTVMNCWGSLMKIPFNILATGMPTLHALRLRTIDHVIRVLPSSLSAESVGLSKELRAKLLQSTVDAVWKSAASRTTLDSARKDLYAVHCTLKSKLSAVESDNS